MQPEIKNFPNLYKSFNLYLNSMTSYGLQQLFIIKFTVATFSSAATPSISVAAAATELMLNIESQNTEEPAWLHMF